jgi:hypothetical protein
MNLVRGNAERESSGQLEHPHHHMCVSRAAAGINTLRLGPKRASLFVS